MGLKTVATDTLARELLETMGQLRRSARSASGRPWPTADLTGAQVDLLRVVRRQPGVSVAVAAAELGVAPNTVSTLVRQLSDTGLLIRDWDASDRRVGRLALTEAARRRLEDWRDHRVAFVADALSRLEAADRATIRAALPALDRLADHLRTVSS